MPLSKSGKSVMASMRGTYGSKKGEEVFYATMQKQGMKYKWEEHSPSRIKRRENSIGDTY